jgi:hypothetical protein
MRRQKRGAVANHPAGRAAAIGTGREQMVFLESASNATTVQGNVGSQAGTPVVDFTSTSALDAANGFSNITPHTGSDFLTPVDITVPGFTFTDLDLSVQLFNRSFVTRFRHRLPSDKKARAI